MDEVYCYFFCLYSSVIDASPIRRLPTKLSW
ncbi:hypothetical protein HMPREF9431_01921 [Segatella oulorum F0390]|uniref:Uncharacterized protein n=1 Tax=Segatella oulorum F0390 TaxID=702438 RepID=G1WDM0_9BACT|nr:hypothetical protein HMPREF9431_01921 [Segatella oulorum F0390]